MMSGWLVQINIHKEKRHNGNTTFLSKMCSTWQCWGEFNESVTSDKNTTTWRFKKHKTMANFTRLSPNPTTKNPTVRPLEILRSPLQIGAWKLELMKRFWSWRVLVLHHLLEHLNNQFFKMDGNGYFPIISCLYCKDLEWSNWNKNF